MKSNSHHPLRWLDRRDHMRLPRWVAPTTTAVLCFTLGFLTSHYWNTWREVLAAIFEVLAYLIRKH